MEKAGFQAHARYLIATDLAAFVFATLVVLVASRIRALISPLAVLVVIAALAVVFGCDVALWIYRGVRSIELDEDSITLFRGSELKPLVISRREIAGLETRRRLMRRVVVVKRWGARAVRITEEAFAPEAFSRFLTVLADWDQRG